jgi:hypothetical protein
MKRSIYVNYNGLVLNGNKVEISDLDKLRGIDLKQIIIESNLRGEGKLGPIKINVGNLPKYCVIGIIKDSINYMKKYELEKVG